MKFIKNYIDKYVDQLVCAKIHKHTVEVYTDISQILYFVETVMEKLAKNSEKENEK